MERFLPAVHDAICFPLLHRSSVGLREPTGLPRSNRCRSYRSDDVDHYHGYSDLRITVALSGSAERP
jgi:hypothetical protein